MRLSLAKSNSSWQVLSKKEISPEGFCRNEHCAPVENLAQGSLLVLIVGVARALLEDAEEMLGKILAILTGIVLALRGKGSAFVAAVVASAG